MATTQCHDIVVGGLWMEVFHAATHLLERCKRSIILDPGCASTSCGRFEKSAPALLVERASFCDAVEQLAVMKKGVSHLSAVCGRKGTIAVRHFSDEFWVTIRRGITESWTH